MAPPTSSGNDDFALKSFVTRNRSLARRSVHGPPKSGIFNLTGNNNSNSQSNDSNSNSNSNSNNKNSVGNAAQSKPKRPVSIISGIDSGSSAGFSGATRTRPMSMISVSSGGGASSSTYGGIPQRNPFKLDLMLENDASTTSINNSSNAQSFNQNVLRNNFSNVDKKIFNTPQMTYSPELNNLQGTHNSTQTINLGPNINHNNNFSEKKYNLGAAKGSPSGPATTKENSYELEYSTNIRSIHRQFNINKFNVSLKTDLLKDVKKGKIALIKEFDKIRESTEANLKTPVVNEFYIKNKMTYLDDEYVIDWEFWKSVIDHYSTKMTKVKSLKKIETVFSNHGVPQCIRPAIYLYLTNSKTQTLEKIYKENSVISFFSKENDLRLRICETFNIDLRCLKSSQEQFDIGDLDKELLQKVDKDLFEILRNFTIYYDRGGYSEIEGLLSSESSPSFVGNDGTGSSIDKTFYLPSKTIISICGLLLKNCARDEGVLNIKTSDAKLTKPEIFSLLIMLNENYFNFDNEINAKNLRIIKERRKQDSSKSSVSVSAAARSDANSISSRRSSMTIDSTSSFSKIIPGKETDLNNIKNNYQSDVNKDKFVYIFNRSLEDLFPEVFLYLTSKGVHTNILLERFVFEFFHRFSENYKWFDNENQDENNIAQENTDPNKEINVSGVSLNKADVDNIKASINDFSLLNIADIKGDLDTEIDNEIFKNCYKLNNENLLRILDMVLIQGVEFLIKFLLLVVEKNYFKIFKIKNNKVLMKFLSSNAVFNFFRDENYKFVTKKIYESEIGQYENISSFVTQPNFPNPFEDVSEPDADEEQPAQKLDVKSLGKNTPLRSDIEKQNKTVLGSAAGGKRKSEKQEKLIEITIKEKKQFGDFIVEALKFEPMIYKYEEELKYLQKEKQAMEAKTVETGTGIGFVNGGDKLGMQNNNSSELSVTSTLTSDFGDNSFTRNSSSSSLSLTNDDLVVTPELKGLKLERKENKIKVMKLQTDLNNLTLTHKSYKEEILIKNEKLNKIKNMNLELKLQKEQLEKRLNDLQLKEELFHSMIQNSNIAKMNDDVKLQIEGCAADIRNVVSEIDGYKAKNKMMRDKYEKPGTPKSSAAAFFSGFGFGRK